MKKILVGFAFAIVLATNLGAQGIYATLTGVVADQSSAVVPQAKVILKDSQSGSQRDSVTNSDGYFTFASVPASEYELTIEAKGFSTFKVTGITLSGGEKRNIDAKLTVGTTSEAVEVTGEVDKVAPVDSAEKTNLITSKELQNFVQVGSNAAEFIKIMPGFGITNGTNNAANYNGQTIGINANGDAGSQSPLNAAYSYNGLPGNSLDITADGAHVSDPGCNCDTPVNPNSDMISEIQVKMSNFDASNQKGPAVITSVAKSGGRDFHGSGFFYARNYVLNANDAVSYTHLYSLVVTMVHNTAARNTAAPSVKESLTEVGMAWPAMLVPETPQCVSSHGRADAITAPRPINRLCMANPWVRCSSGSRSATNARNGSMLMLMEASSIHNRPAAIHSAETLGITRSAAELRIAPTRK